MRLSSPERLGNQTGNCVTFRKGKHNNLLMFRDPEESKAKQLPTAAEGTAATTPTTLNAVAKLALEAHTARTPSELVN